MKRSLFLKGKAYEPNFGFNAGQTLFSRADILICARDGYSPYDEAFIYEFHTLSGETKSWVMPESADNDYRKGCFVTLQVTYDRFIRRQASTTLARMILNIFYVRKA